MSFNKIALMLLSVVAAAIALPTANEGAQRRDCQGAPGYECVYGFILRVAYRSRVCPTLVVFKTLAVKR